MIKTANLNNYMKLLQYFLKKKKHKTKFKNKNIIL